MPPVLNLEDATSSSSKNLVPYPKPKLTHAGPSARTRQLTPRSGTSRSTFSPPSTPAHSPPQAISEENLVDEKQDDDDELRASAQGENHPRHGTFSEGEGSVGTLDENAETIRSHPLENNKPDARETTSGRRLYLFGYALPHWWTSRPSRRDVSTVIVKYAPCFWCTKPSDLSMTSRSIVLRLMLLCAIFGLVQVGSATYLLVVLLSDKVVDRDAQHVYQEGGGNNTLNLWNVNASVVFAGLLGAITFLVMIFTRRAIAEVNFSGSLRFMWYMLWVIPLEIYVTVGMFDYHRVNEIWVRHWWIFRSMAFFREEFCADDTYNTLCVVPIDGLPLFNSTSQWCMAYYNSTACAGIQADAQGIMDAYSFAYYNVNAGIALLLTILLSLAYGLVEGMITKSVVQKNRESHIAGWLVLPIVLCCAQGSVLLFYTSSIMRYTDGLTYWPGVVLMSASGFYLLAAILGCIISSLPILSNRDKRGKLVALTLFIGTMILAMLLMAAIFSYSVVIAVNAVSVNLTEEQRGRMACQIGGETCSFCGNDEGLTECPEWTKAEIVKVFRSDLKHAAAAAAILVFYTIGPLRFGFAFRKHISTYEIDYV